MLTNSPSRKMSKEQRKSVVGDLFQRSNKVSIYDEFSPNEKRPVSILGIIAASKLTRRLLSTLGTRDSIQGRTPYIPSRRSSTLSSIVSIYGRNSGTHLEEIPTFQLGPEQPFPRINLQERMVSLLLENVSAKQPYVSMRGGALAKHLTNRLLGGIKYLQLKRYRFVIKCDVVEDAPGLSIAQSSRCLWNQQFDLVYNICSRGGKLEFSNYWNHHENEETIVWKAHNQSEDLDSEKKSKNRFAIDHTLPIIILTVFALYKD